MVPVPGVAEGWTPPLVLPLMPPLVAALPPLEPPALPPPLPCANALVALAASIAAVTIERIFLFRVRI
jgi:hypothetical protein